MRVTDSSGGYGGTIVVDIGGVRRASGLLADDAHAFQELAARVRTHPLPAMPEDVSGRVAAVLAEVGTGLAGLPPTLVDLAQELRVRAFWAEIADKLAGGYDLKGAELTEFKAAYASGLLTRYAEPWQTDLANAYAKKVHDQEHPGGIAGFVHGVGDFFSGAWDAIKDPAVMIYHLTPFSGGDWTKNWANLGHGLAYGVTHPVEFGKALINLDALQQRGFGYWLGNLTPAIAATLLSGGAAAAARGAEGAVAIDRAAEGVTALDRAAEGAGALDRTAAGVARVSTGGAGPVLRGAAGVDRAAADIEAAGGRVLGREITLDVNGVRTRPDLFVKLPNGQDAFIEVKTGPSAGLTPNQAAAYPRIPVGGAVPAGRNAAAAGLEPGVPLGPTRIWVVRQPWPLPASP